MGPAQAYWTDLQHGAPPARPPRLRRLGPTLLTTLLVATALGLLAVRSAGLQPLTVLTGSMRPAIDPGDLVLVSAARADAVRPGQVITFVAPGRADGRTVTHRLVRSAPLSDDRVAMVTQGDANPAPERWTIAASGRVGVVRTTLPAVGFVAHPLSAGWTRGALLGLLTLVGAGSVLWVIWRPSKGRS